MCLRGIIWQRVRIRKMANSKIIIILLICLGSINCFKSGKSRISENIILHVSSDTSYYEIDARTRQEIYDQIQKMGPNLSNMEAAASIRYEFSWNIIYNEKIIGDCHPNSGFVNLRMNYTFPRWTNYTTADNDLKNQWDSYFSLLALHEDGHKDIVLAYGQKLTDTIQDFHHDNCQEFDRLLEQKCKEVVNQCKLLNKKYDHETEHGKKQGAVWIIK